MKKTLYVCPPVKALRVKKWQAKALAGMLPRRVARSAERHPSLKRLLQRKSGDGQAQWYRAAYGFSENEFRCYGFADKTREERLTYLSDRESVLLSYLVNDLDAMGIFSDKWRTYRRFGDVFGREAVCVASLEDLGVLTDFLARHPVFTAKPAFGACGAGVRQIDAAAYDSAPSLLSALTADGKTVVEETIRQSDVMASLHPASVNTVRVVTLMKDDTPALLWAFLKTGRGGAFTDNGAAGGVMAGIDPASGRVTTDGIDESGTRYARHPDTGVPFNGFLLPEWKDLRKKCEALACVVPEVKLVGWDMAHTPSGWVMVEGNAQPEMIGPQAVFGHGMREQALSLVPHSAKKVFRVNG